MCSAAAELSTEAQNLFSGCPPEYTEVLSTMCGALTRIDTELRQELDEVMTEAVIAPIDAVVDVMNEVRVDMHGREYLKLDFDAHHRKVASLKAKGTTDPAELRKLDSKLAQDREGLAATTKALYDAFDDMERKRWSVITSELNAFVSAQTAFFQRAAEVTRGMATFPAELPRAPIPLTAATSTPFGPITPQGYLPGFPHLYGEGPPPSAGEVGVKGAGGAGTARPHRATLQPTVSDPSSPAPQQAGVKAYPTVAAIPPAVAQAAAASHRRRSSVSEDPSHAAAAKAAVAASRQAPPPTPPVPRKAADRVRACFKFSPSSPDELGMAVGDVVEVLRRHDDGWGEGMNTTSGQRGMFPLNYVEPLA